MDQQEITKHWVESANRNASLADDLYKLHHYSWCLFMWHLGLEKLFKSVISSNGEEIPFTHDLVKLALLSGREFSKDKLNELEEITTYNIEARYEDYKEEFYKKATKEYTDIWKEKCREIFLWLQN